jgi:aryl-phospho-beta-D-glucosidase BglC (GH1 family)
MRLTAIPAIALLAAATLSAAPLPEPSPNKLPRWRGFNLLEKFMFNGKHQPFIEDDFRMISELGFNFVRLPMDYRGYIAEGNWERFDEKPLAQIDQAVEWGKRHGIHVCINLHRAPGWTVAKPPEAKDLWTDPETQRVAALHWGMFARRYMGVPNSLLSFNLFNEPTSQTDEAYTAVVAKMVDAIRAEDPNRLVLCDGLSWGTKPVAELIPLKVGQMTRGYTPFQLTHFGASWVGDNTKWEAPSWPSFAGTNGALLSPNKGEESSHPLLIEGPLAAGSTLRLTLTTLSSNATLVVRSGNDELLRREWIAGPDKGPWEKSAQDPRWNNWVAEGRVDVPISLERATDRIEMRVTGGDWLVIGEIGITPPGGGKEATVRLENKWDARPEILRYFPKVPALGIAHDREWLRRESVDPWKSLTSAGGGVMVGEWGAFQKTPHDVVLRWSEDSLRNWKDAGWGWALWNFRGPFGILDSGRGDVSYENHQGHKLDRKLLEILQRN